MTSQPSSGPKLTEPQRMEVFALIARGDTSTKINEHLESKYSLSLSPSTISDMKKRHGDIIDLMRNTIAEHQAIEAEAIMQKSRNLMNRKLDKASRDMTEIEELDKQFREGEIGDKEYRRLKTGLLNVSLAELNMVSKDMYAQTKKGGDDDKPEANNPASTEALLDAIKRGDTVELQRIILNP